MHDFHFNTMKTLLFTKMHSLSCTFSDWTPAKSRQNAVSPSKEQDIVIYTCTLFCLPFWQTVPHDMKKAPKKQASLPEINFSHRSNLHQYMFCLKTCLMVFFCLDVFFCLNESLSQSCALYSIFGVSISTAHQRKLCLTFQTSTLLNEADGW